MGLGCPLNQTGILELTGPSLKPRPHSGGLRWNWARPIPKDNLARRPARVTDRRGGRGELRRVV